MSEQTRENHTSENGLLKPTSDVFLASLLSSPQNEHILCDLINAVLVDSNWPPVQTASVINPFSIREFAADKRIVLDVRVKDELGQKYNIEIQTSPHVAFRERILFGWADSYSMQIHAGENYSELRPVFCIVIVEFNIFPNAEGVHLIFEARERNNHDVLMSNQMQIHVLRLYEVLCGRLESQTGVHADLRHWLNFLVFGSEKGEEEMSQLVENDPILLEARNELARFSSDPNVQDYFRRLRLAEFDYNTRIHDAQLEGKAKGEAEGEARGKAEGKAEGEVLAILTVLKTRYGLLPQNLPAKVYTVNDFDRLAELTALAVTSKSLAEFEAALE
ncbi:MAG: Rpn family recombination-promoting nuclease/putative transposase [Thermoguttaceae bacterium]